MKRFLIIFILGLFSFLAVRSQSATISVSSPLNEADLDIQALTLDLTDETFADGTLDVGNFSPNNAPNGLTVYAVVLINMTQAVLDLAFNGNDFDIDIPNFSISIDDSELSQTSSGQLTTNNLTINAYDERLAITPDASLEEQTLDARSLSIGLSDEEFTSIGSIPNEFFTLNQEPRGLVIESVTAADATHAVMQLAYPPGNDFDNPISNFSITVSGAILRYTSPGNDITSNNLTIAANDETPQATLGVDSTVLEERWLDVRILTINLVEESFTDYTRLRDKDFELLDEPPGLTMESIIGTSEASVDILLRFNQRDFDTDYPDLRVKIKKDALEQSGSDLVSSRLTAIASIESATLVPDQPLREDILDGRVLTITLVNEEFETPGSVDQKDFDLRNEPSGLSIRSAFAISATEAELILRFDGSDFDSDIHDFTVRIKKDELRYNTEDDLDTGPITIQAIGDNPVAILSVDSVLTEHRLDARELTIMLIQEEFDGSVILDESHFRLVNEPSGLTIESAYRISSGSARILLQFDYTDFDNHIPDFHVLIDPAALVHSTQDLASGSLSIQASLEPVITNVQIQDDTMKIGEQVTVTIRVESDNGNIYNLNSGEVGGFPLTSLSRMDNTTYITSFTVTEGGNDYAAYENIPVTDLQLYNGLVPGVLYDQTIIQGNDLLDANSPDIQHVTALSSGPANIGSVIWLQINADQAGYIFTPTSHVNDVPLSSSSIEITALGSGNYDLRYTLEEGDNDVSEGNLELEIVAEDIAGNLSSPFSSLSPNNISIDASRPTIDRASISSIDSIIRVGETLEIIVEADQSGYRVHENTWINEVPVGPNLIFTDLGNGLYRFLYTVSDVDGTVSKGNLTINIVLRDRDPYENRSLTFAGLDPNNVIILTEWPSAGVSGTTEICSGESTLVTVTLGGLPPWEFDIFDGTTTLTLSNIPDPVYQFQTQPELNTNYTVPRVIDGTGNNNIGFGNALITVNQLPDVEILNLQETYDIEEGPVVLDFTPAGGTFTGTGITHPPWTFIPSLAGTEGSPHEIIYSYTNDKSCTNTDTVIVQVIESGGFISFERSVACFNDSAFYITGVNDGNTIGTFSVLPSPPEGAFSDLDNNRAILRPALYDLSENLDVKIIYSFTDTIGIENTLIRNLTIEKLEGARINPIPDIHFCQNDAPIVLTGIPATGVFFGTGITWNSILGYQFDPAHADQDTNLIRFTYTSYNHCSVDDSAKLIVYDAPFADFTTAGTCIPEDGGLIQFVNRSDTGNSQNVSWTWDFGDVFSGEENFSDLRNPSHYYDELGGWTIKLEVDLDNGCSDFIQKNIDILTFPKAEFTWNSNCQTDDPILLEGRYILDNSDSVSSSLWRIYSGDTIVFLADSNQLTYNFPSDGPYRIVYRITTFAGCSDSTEETLSLIPTYTLSEDSYFEDFEIPEEHGWSSMALDPPQNSWTYGEVNPNKFPETAASGSRAWYTELTMPRKVENSWVQSPCFDFRGFYSPMVSADIKRSLSRNHDGAAIQYTLDNGETWTNVGVVNDGGLNWYNSEKILNGPGGQNTGWTAESEASEDEHWSRAAHWLDELTGHKEVQFRIGFSSIGSDTLSDGFAFDNFTIRERSRLSVLEYFSNANNPLCYETDTLVRKLIEEIPADVIDIQYHMIGSMADKLYDDNPVPPNNRGAVYGVTGIPMAILDGGYEEGIGYPLIYDFSTKFPNAEDIKLRSLTEPDFKLMVEIEYAPHLEITVNVEALKDMVRRERILYVFVLEKHIMDPEYTGTNGSTKFYNVARKMLPDAAGTLFSQSWIKGEIKSIELTYEETFFPLIRDSLSVGVYLQDENTREILQAATKPEYSSVSTIDLPGPQSQVLLYPNPAGELLNLYFEDVPREMMLFNLYNLSGKMVITEVIEPWQQHYTRNLGGLEQGLYIVEIRTRNNKLLIHRGKLFHY